MSYFLSFEMPGLPTTLNSRVHWAVKNKERKEWHRLIALFTAGKRPKSPLRTAELTLTRISTQDMDRDNMASGFKPIIDGLVRCGIIEDDTHKHIGTPDYCWEKGKPKQGRVRVEVRGVLNCNETSDVNPGSVETQKAGTSKAKPS